ncbi:MAG: hypothetical protein KZQ59_11110 [Candidatus Thiodiazotropha sp. (ex Lucinoma aequizonata)]|nr:hypothetical protein [Candidatus Thiodiazotropha sp. (ex Lucinoma aequizonata)]MCU7900365.1 hypothetical protein [Candidatus Thiodiazotropha sp. (ex Lucinoma aequizonata)]
MYALHLSLLVAIPAIQPRLRLSGTNRLRSAFHGGQRRSQCGRQRLLPGFFLALYAPHEPLPD